MIGETRLEHYQRARATQADLRGKIPPGSMWRHLKTGHVYVIITLALAEENMTHRVIYQRSGADFPPGEADHTVWDRFAMEFLDGRFERALDKEAHV